MQKCLIMLNKFNHICLASSNTLIIFVKNLIYEQGDYPGYNNRESRDYPKY